MCAKKISDKDFAEILREKAKAGDAEFQFRVSQCYYFGYGIEKNYDEYIKWCKLAAEQGHSGAQCDLGCAYHHETGVEKNLNESLKWYELSANQGNAIAQNHLANFYRNGEGVAHNYDKALDLYSLSDEQDYWRASWNLGNMYYDGIGVDKDFAKAKTYYEKSLSVADMFWDGWGYANEENKAFLQERIDEISAKLNEAEEKAKLARQAKRAGVFISYAHVDEKYRNELSGHLKMLTEFLGIEWWDDTQLKAGEKWDEEIQGSLSKAKIAILMISANFFSSDYVLNKELPKIMELAENEGATIIWVPVVACDYEITPLKPYQAITDPKSPLASLDENKRHEVYTKLTKRVKELVKVQPELSA